MDLSQLQHFAAAARLLSFTQAARECFVSQPWLSQQIAALEAELKTELFVRKGRSVTLTAAGETLLLHAERILADVREARLAVQETAGMQRGRLSVWTLPTPGQHLLPPILARYRTEHPGVEISLREAVPARAVAEAVAQGHADVGIVHKPYQVRGLAERVLFEEELALVVPEGHRFRSDAPTPLAAAAEEDFISAPEGGTDAHPLFAACLAAGFTPRIACVSGSAQGMQALVAAGLGIAILPRLAIHPPSGTRVVSLAAPTPTRTVAVVWDARSLSAAAASFIALLVGVQRSADRQSQAPGAYAPGALNANGE